MPIVYADVLIALNWLTDFLLLCATACLLHIPSRRICLTLSSFFGGVYALVLLLPPLPSLMRFVADLAVAVGMVFIAFPHYPLKMRIKQTLVLFLVSALFSGIVSAFGNLFLGEYVCVNNGAVYVDISPLMVAIFAMISYTFVRVLEYVIQKRMPKGGEYRLTVRDDKAVFEGRALCDTGLRLREPFSGAPVIVMEREKVLSCVSDEVKTALEETKAHARVRMIPYRTVSGAGVLPAFRPRRVQIERFGEKRRDITGVYVALCDDLGRGEYEALVGNDCCEGWVEK